MKIISKSSLDLYDCVEHESDFNHLSDFAKERMRAMIKSGKIFMFTNLHRDRDTMLVLDVVDSPSSVASDMVLCVVLTKSGRVEERFLSVHREAV